MNKCNGCSITNEKTFPFIAISNIYSRYVLYKRTTCILGVIIIMLTTLLIYMCYDLYKDNDPYGNLEDVNMNTSIEENTESVEEESYYCRKPNKFKRKKNMRINYGKI